MEIGLIFDFQRTSDITRSYSRKGQSAFARLPEGFRHGDYQFLTPRDERAAMRQFVSDLCEPGHVVLPVIQLPGPIPPSDSTVSVKPIWLLAALGDLINSELEAHDPLTRDNLESDVALHHTLLVEGVFTADCALETLGRKLRILFKPRLTPPAE